MKDYEKILEEMRDYKPSTPPGVIEDFMKGSLHQDFKNEIVTRIEVMRDFYEQCDSKKYLETRGGIHALRMVMEIFKNLLDNRIKDLEEEERNEEDV